MNPTAMLCLVQACFRHTATAADSITSWHATLPSHFIARCTLHDLSSTTTDDAKMHHNSCSSTNCRIHPGPELLVVPSTLQP
jgi:hypothetical protein